LNTLILQKKIRLNSQKKQAWSRSRSKTGSQISEKESTPRPRDKHSKDKKTSVSIFKNNNIVYSMGPLNNKDVISEKQ